MVIEVKRKLVKVFIEYYSPSMLNQGRGEGMGKLIIFFNPSLPIDRDTFPYQKGKVV